MEVREIERPQCASISITSSNLEVEWQNMPIIDGSELHFWFVLCMSIDIIMTCFYISIRLTEYQPTLTHVLTILCFSMPILILLIPDTSFMAWAVRFLRDGSLARRWPSNAHRCGAWSSKFRAIPSIEKASICPEDACPALKCHPDPLFASVVISLLSVVVKC